MSNNIVDLTGESSEQGRPFLKSGSYTVRILKCEKQVSKKKNNMLVFTYEIAAPDSVKEDNGNTRKITGMQLNDWIVLSDDNEGARKRLKALLEMCDMPLRLDIENPAQLLPFKGKAIRVMLATEGGTMLDENTGQPILDGQGNPINANQYRIRRFIAADPSLTISPENMSF